MIVREMINKLMDMDIDKPIYITKTVDSCNNKTIGFVDNKPIEISKLKIIDVDMHGVYGSLFNCITISEED